MKRQDFSRRLRPLALAVLLSVGATAAHADDREALERLRQTTLNIINALVETGVLTRERANELIRDAEAKAEFQVRLAREKAGELPPPGEEKKPAPVRVQYIPESTKKEIRDQIRKEVLSQAREEHWADPNVLPSWLDKIKLGGDILTRYQFDNYDSTNTKPRDYVYSSPGATTRQGNFANTGDSVGNTTDDMSQLRLRVRLAADIKMSKDTTAGLRIASGNSDSRVSTTQTLGSTFNKYSLWLDRGFIKHSLSDYFHLSAGRMANPFASSDLVWDDNINFDGLSLNVRDRLADGFVPYATMGVFPLATESQPKTGFSRTLLAAQIGAANDLSAKTRGSLGLAYYRYRNLEGRPDGDSSYLPTQTNSYGNTEYSSSQRQKGNTLVRLNAPSDSSTTNIWGLASKFAPLHLGSSLDYARSDTLHFVASADFVKNMAFDRNEIEKRTGVRLTDGSATGYQFRMLVGTPAVRKKSEWNASLTFRRLGSDAVPDAFAEGTLGGGGTNVRGYIMGFNYGVDSGTVLGFKYLSGSSIDSPTTRNSSDKFRLNTWQMDLGVGF
ncbi:putative porin [Viridibacterium curvum]|uniref:Porin n=1 Tax=Viridibacterium curvum TaxID=1101404 RepID=A0ABP9QKU1_9RHOO